MGVFDWFRGSSSPKAVEKLKGDRPITKEAVISDETHATWKKILLYLYLASLALVWNDLFHTIGGVWMQIVGVLILGYMLVLCYPGSWGSWDIADRMQIRSVLIIKLTAVSMLFGIPLWALLVADRRWFPMFASVGIIRTIFLIYIAWFCFFDRKAGSTGCRYVKSMRRRRFWKHLAQYFPIRLTRTHELDPERNYLFGYHPHGIISVGAITNFGTFATGFDELFPGIDLRLLTLTMNFRLPLLREFYLAMGFNDVSKESIANNLAVKNRSVLLVVGGAAESIETNPAENTLILENRKGFIKMAMRTGADLVPVFSFGENDIFEVIHFTGKWKSVQMWLQKKMGFAMPLFFGRALTGGLEHRLFGMNAGLFPFRIPIHSVVGKPVKMSQKYKEEEITNENIDKYHDLYLAELKKIHDEWKPIFEKEKQERLEELKANSMRKSILDDDRFHNLSNETKDMKIK